MNPDNDVPTYIPPKHSSYQISLKGGRLARWTIACDYSKASPASGVAGASKTSIQSVNRIEAVPHEWIARDNTSSAW